MTTAVALAGARDRISGALAEAAPQRAGRVTSVVGLGFQIGGLDLPIGSYVDVDVDGDTLPAEVVACARGSITCLPFGTVRGLRVGSLASPSLLGPTVPVGHELLGRIIDAFGNPLDDGPPFRHVDHVGIDGEPPHPLRRERVHQRLSLGVRAWDSMAPMGRGQRVGVFAGSGVGKSTLMGMVARGSQADVNVVALIGERGREIREFVEEELGPEGMARSVVVVATSDTPALVRLRAADAATRIAEWFRDGDADVVLMMDSITRYCMAQREIGLAAGEPPTSRGYPPSVFTLLPRLLERAGTAQKGSITGIYTVLVDGDDHNEPVADAVRSILDGHVVLSRDLAHSGHYPAIDVLASVSRVQNAVSTPDERDSANELRSLLAAHRDARDLIEIGAYVAGSNPTVDRAVQLEPQINAFLRQTVEDRTDAATTTQRMVSLVRGSGAMA
ncbi:MAG: FliI/YscN family ATPase [Actinomycetota bacterium]